MPSPLTATSGKIKDPHMNHLCTFGPRFLASSSHLALLLGTLLVASALVGCSEPARQRKNVKDLTPAEREDYVHAVLKLKQTPSPYSDADGMQLNWYDLFVTFHKMVYHERPRDQDNVEYQIGHQSPTFLPWHRKFLLIYEQKLRDVSGKDISLPYWDWTDEASIAVVFADDFMGPGGDEAGGYVVSGGPFSKDYWQINVFPKDEVTRTPSLIRKLGTKEDLPRRKDWEECLKLATYDASPWNEKAPREVSFRNCLEGWGHHQSDNHLHNSAHIWVGGVI